MSGLGRFESVALFRNARCTLRLPPADGDEVSISGFVSSAKLLGLHEFDDRISQARVAVQVEEDSSEFDVNNFWLTYDWNFGGLNMKLMTSNASFMTGDSSLNKMNLVAKSGDLGLRYLDSGDEVTIYASISGFIDDDWEIFSSEKIRSHSG